MCRQTPAANPASAFAGTRHGIAARSQHYRANGIGTGNVILSRAADDGADLIVMGGVTLHMLEHMTVPVLMSH